MVAAEVGRDPQFCARRGPLGETLLHYFAVEYQPELVRALAASGAEVDVENEFGKTPLMEAGMLENLEMMTLLLELGAKVNHQSSSDQSTALHIAVEFDKSKAYRLLIDAGADPTLKNAYGEMATTLPSSN